MAVTTGKAPGKRALKSRINKGLSDNIGRLAKMISKGTRNEDETRRWIIDVLKQGFGYTDDDIETEYKALGQRVDIVLMENGSVFAVIECKAVNIDIKQRAINQAANYATSLGAEWAIVTNGQAWGLYHVATENCNTPEIIEVFFVELLDEDGISKDDVELLYLITKKAFFSGETEGAYHDARIYNEKYLLDTLFSDSVTKAVAKELAKRYKKDCGVVFEDIDPAYIKELLEMYLEPLLEE